MKPELASGFFITKIFLYNEKVKRTRMQQKTRRQRRKGRKRITIIIISILAIIGSFIFIMNHDTLAVQDVRLAGQKTLIDQDILSVIDEYKKGRYAGIIRKDNILVMSTGEITRLLKTTFPTIEKISVDIEGSDALLITIGERSAHSLWCIDQEYELAFEEECYFADASGLIYARAPYFSGNIYLKLFIPETETDIIGTTIDKIPSFQEFFALINHLELEENLQIARVVFKQNNDVEFELARLKQTVYNDQRPVIIFNMSDSYETIVRNIHITLNYETFKRDFTSTPDSLESIDVRFDGRVFYSFGTPS